MKIYVASPCDGLLKSGYTKKFVNDLAKTAKYQAVNAFGFENEYFTPVQDLQIDSICSRQEIMHKCFKELDKCDVLFIPEVFGTILSNGIRQEFLRALNNKIIINFANINIQNIFHKCYLQDFKRVER